jgi:hypothetical protein
MSQDEDNPSRKKPRLEEPLPTTTDEAARKTPSADLSLGLPPPSTADDDDDSNANADADSVTDTQPNAVATGYWKPEEDAKLTSAVAKTGKKKHGEKYRTDWNAITALVPGRTGKQCWSRWKLVLDPSIALTAGRTGKWTEDEDTKLKDVYKRSVRRIGSQLPSWSQVERIDSAVTDGIMFWIPASIG